jgi:predicted metalloprotease
VPVSVRLKASIIAIAILCLTAIVGSDRAAAMTPAQSTESGVVNMLGGWVPAHYSGSIEDFWRRTLPAWGYSYSKPSIFYYGPNAGGYYNTVCGGTSRWYGENGFYCPTNNSIYLDYQGQQGLLNRLGDHGSGGFLAHEWAHRAQARMGTITGDYRTEYNADCMAGLYTRFGYNTGRLNGGDYWEFYNWLYYQPSSPSHGTGANRAAWYQYGYTQYTKGACDQAFGATSAQSARTATIAAARALRPPALGKVDRTPRRTNALPKGAERIVIPKGQRVDPHTPIH